MLPRKSFALSMNMEILFFSRGLVLTTMIGIDPWVARESMAGTQVDQMEQQVRIN